MVEPIAAARFDPGQIVVRRGLHPDGRIGQVECGRVVSDDERGLLIWVGLGSTQVRRASLDGDPTRPLPLLDELGTPTIPVLSTWDGYGNLMLIPPDAAHSLWWSWDHQGRTRTSSPR